MNRRRFLTTALTSTAAAAASPSARGQFLNAPRHGLPGTLQERYAKLDAILKQPVFKRELFPDPVIIESVELLTARSNTSAGCAPKRPRRHLRLERAADGVALSHLHERIAPFLSGKMRATSRAHPGRHRLRKQLQGAEPCDLGAHRYHRVRDPRHVRQDGQAAHRPADQRQDLQPEHLRLSGQRRARHLGRRNHRAPQARRGYLPCQGDQVQARRAHSRTRKIRLAAAKS